MANRTSADVSAADGPRRFIVFEAGQRRYAAEVRHVSRVVRAVGITPVPRTPPHMLGVVEMRGYFVPVFDYALVDGSRRTLASREAYAVAFGEGDPELALLADGAPTYVNLEDDGAEGPAAADGESIRAGRIPILDGEALLADRRFYL